MFGFSIVILCMKRTSREYETKKNIITRNNWKLSNVGLIILFDCNKSLWCSNGVKMNVASTSKERINILFLVCETYDKMRCNIL